jgi:hypothetical protein
MDVDNFLTGFFKGTLGKKSTHGQYTVYSKNMLTGDDFSSHVLMRDPVKVNATEDPVWVGSYFGDGVALAHAPSLPRGYNKYDLINGRTQYHGNLRLLWESHDVTEAGLVDANEEGAVIEFEGSDYLLHEFPMEPVLAQAWAGGDARGRKRLVRLEDRCGSVAEAKRMAVGEIGDKTVMCDQGILTPTKVDYDFKPCEERAICPHPAGFALPREWWPIAGERISFTARYHGGMDPDKLMLKDNIDRYNSAVDCWANTADMAHADKYGFDVWERWKRTFANSVSWGKRSTAFGMAVPDDRKVAVKFNESTDLLSKLHGGWWIARPVNCVMAGIA